SNGSSSSESDSVLGSEDPKFGGENLVKPLLLVVALEPLISMNIGSTYEFDEVCASDELQTKKIIKFRIGGRAHSFTFLEFLRRLGLYQTTELVEDGFNVYFEGDPQLGVPRVGIPRPPRVSMHDLYDRMGGMEIRQDAIERMEYRQSYHWDRYQGVFEHMAGVYSVPLQGAYNPPGYAQPQYDQYYQQYQPPQQQQDDDE
ncbi:hypothetical protein Tco_0723227, partial [Tanacetum coccineum]